MVSEPVLQHLKAGLGAVRRDGVPAPFRGGKGQVLVVDDHTRHVVAQAPLAKVLLDGNVQASDPPAGVSLGRWAYLALWLGYQGY